MANLQEPRQIAGFASTPGRWKRYPAYKPSGVDWLGDIPAHWLMKRLKFVATALASNVDKKSVEGEQPVRLCNYVDVYYCDRITKNIEFLPATASSDQIKRFSLRRDDVIITKDSESWTDIAVAALVADDLDGVVCGYHLALVRSAPTLMDAAYLARAFAASGIRDQFHVAANGITRYGLSQHAIDNALLPVPPVPEQRAIAAFLDRETARSDALVAKKERLIELFQGKRTALITHAVTKGLNPSAPMKESGIEWLGQIPTSWQVKRLMYLTSDDRPIMYGIVLPGPNTDDGVPIVKGGDVAPGRLRLDLLNRTTREIEAGYARSRLQGGDIVYAIRGSIGAAEIVPAELRGANLTQDAARIAPKSGVEGRWLLFAVRSKGVFGQLDAGAMGAAVKGINIRDLKRAVLPVPPAHEQREIASFLERGTEKLDTLIGKVREHIERLREYRIALISAAVTGRIDVRGEVAS